MLATSPLAANKKGQDHSQYEAGRVDSPLVLAKSETKQSATTAIQKPYVYNQICCPSQSRRLNRMYIKWASGKSPISYRPCTTCTSGAAATPWVQATMWQKVSQFLMFVLSQVPLSPTRNHLEWRKDSHKLWFSFQSPQGSIHFLLIFSFTGFSLGPLQSLRMVCIL